MALIRPHLPRLAFTMVPNAWARDGELRPNAKAVLIALLSHAEGYKLSTAQLMRETGLGRDGVDSAIDHMLARGYLVSVEQRQGERGRWAQNDYTLTDCTDTVPPIPVNPPKRGRKVGIAPQRSQTATVPDRDGAAHHERKTPQEKTNTTEDQHPAAAATGDGAARTIGQRARAIAADHHEAVGGMAPFMGVVKVVERALTVPVSTTDPTPRYDDEQVAAALAVLRDAGRPVTLQTLHAALETPQSVGGRRQTGPYRDPAPAAYTGRF